MFGTEYCDWFIPHRYYYIVSGGVVSRSEDKNVPILGTPIPAFKLMKPFTTPSTTGRPVTVVSENQPNLDEFCAAKKLTCSNTAKRFLLCNILLF